jgi:hypothetical protein
MNLTASTGNRIGPGENRNDFVLGIKEGIQRHH